MARREESNIEKVSKDTSYRDKRYTKEPLKGVVAKEKRKIKKNMETHKA